MTPLHWRHNERGGVSDHQPHDCLLSRLFRRRSKKTSNLHVTGLCVGNSPVTGEFPAQRASNSENVSIWWRHHDPYDKWNCAFVKTLRVTFINALLTHTVSINVLGINKELLKWSKGVKHLFSSVVSIPRTHILLLLSRCRPYRTQGACYGLYQSWLFTAPAGRTWLVKG